VRNRSGRLQHGSFSRGAVFLAGLIVLQSCAEANSGSTPDPGTGRWTPPVGIPAPSFGIEETVADTAFTHWIDNSAPCSDAADGTPAAPRCTLPTNLPAGAKVQIRGGPYDFPTDATWSAAGTAGNPVFVRGPAAPASRPLLRFDEDARLTLHGSYLIVENLEMRSGAVRIDASSHHVAVRHFLLHDNPSGPGSFLANFGDDVVVYDCEIAGNGVIPSSSDDHGFQTLGGTRNVWVLESHIHHNSGDAIQFCHTCIGRGDGPANVYIGRNRLHHDEENAIDIKETLGPVVISENELYGYQPGAASGNGDAIRINDEGDQGEIWILNNRVHSSTIGINAGESDARTYILGNRLWDLRGFGIGFAGRRTIVANNTVVNTPRGIRGGTEVTGNIVSGATSCHICRDAAGCSNNLVWQPGGSPVVEAACSDVVRADPLMIMSGNEQTGLQPASPALGSGFANPAYGYYQSTYGIDIRRDPVGTLRPQGSAWDIGAYEVPGR
jgi:hypothetical protein